MRPRQSLFVSERARSKGLSVAFDMAALKVRLTVQEALLPCAVAGCLPGFGKSARVFAGVPMSMTESAMRREAIRSTEMRAFHITSAGIEVLRAGPVGLINTRSLDLSIDAILVECETPASWRVD